MIGAIHAKTLIYGVALAVIGAAIVTTPSKTHAQRAYGGMMGGYGGGTRPGDWMRHHGELRPGHDGRLSDDGRYGRWQRYRLSRLDVSPFSRRNWVLPTSKKSVWDAYAETIKSNLQSMQGM